MADDVTYYPRALERAVQTVNRGFPALLVTGPRQSGKTTLLRHVAGEGRTYVSLDDPASRGLAKEDPRLFLERYAAPVLIDEIQYAPGLLPYIKMAIDENRTPGAFWLTGSQQFQMMKGVTESLAGRIGILNLLGFSQRERTRGTLDVAPFLPTREALASRQAVPSEDSAAIFRRIWEGSFPGLISDETVERGLFMSSYVQTYLERDVRDLSQVGDLDDFARFVRACAARSAQLLNLSELARDVDVKVATAKNWLSVLRASFQVYLLQPYHSNLTKRLVKTPKLYFLDTGLMAHLTDWPSPESLASGAMAGAAFETYVVSEIVRSWWHRGEQPPLYYYRDKDKREIDLVFDTAGKLFPVEIKRSATVKRDWAKSFVALERLGKPVGEGAVVCLVPETVPISREVDAIPVGYV